MHGCRLLCPPQYILHTQYLVNLQSTILLFEGVIRTVLGLAHGRPASFKKWKFWTFYLKHTRKVFSSLLGLLPRSQMGISVDPYLERWDILLLTTSASLTMWSSCCNKIAVNKSKWHFIVVNLKILCLSSEFISLFSFFFCIPICSSCSHSVPAIEKISWTNTNIKINIGLFCRIASRVKCGTTVYYPLHRVPLWRLHFGKLYVIAVTQLRHGNHKVPTIL